MVERTLISFPSQVQLTERLQHLLYLSSSMIFISGEKGSGKTTLIEQLSNQLPNQTLQAFITLSEPISATKIRQQIISQLVEEPLFDADDSLYDTLLLLKDKQPSETARIIVIDNAELLPAVLLIELAEVIKQKSLLTESEINFILLSDEQTSKQMLDKVKGLAITTLAFKLAPLNQQEALQLLQHAFGQLGYSAKLEHQDALLKQLLLCNGIPQKILLLASEINKGEREDSSPAWLKTRLPALLLMILLIISVVGLAYYLYPTFSEQQVTPEVVIETEAVLLDEIEATDLITDEEDASLAGTQSTERLAGQWSNGKEAISDNLLSVGEADNGQRVIISEAQLFELYGKRNVADEVEHEPNIGVTIPKVAKPVVEKVVIEKPILEKLQQVKSVAPVVLIEPKVEPVIEPPPSAVEKSQSVQQQTTATEAPFTSRALLLAVNPDKYTLQLSAMSSKKSLQGFIEQYQLPQADVYLYKTIRDGKTWYVVIYGQFKTWQEATQVAKHLPNRLINLDSWIKKYASVQQDLQLNE